MFEHLRQEARPIHYVCEVRKLGWFKWRWVVSERMYFPPTDQRSHQDTTIIFGDRRSRRRAETVGRVMRDGFIHAPLPPREPVTPDPGIPERRPRHPDYVQPRDTTDPDEIGRRR
jgi:hypothetical protein